MKRTVKLTMSILTIGLETVLLFIVVITFYLSPTGLQRGIGIFLLLLICFSFGVLFSKRYGKTGLIYGIVPPLIIGVFDILPAYSTICRQTEGFWEFISYLKSLPLIGLWFMHKSVIILLGLSVLGEVVGLFIRYHHSIYSLRQ
ncbi:MAG: hypothetical protein AB1567_07850 [bacterium]